MPNRLAILAALVAALAAAPSLAFADTLSGTVSESSPERSFELPRAHGAFYRLHLEGREGTDIDLRVTDDAGGSWVSESTEPVEELLIPAEHDLTATVYIFDGASSSFRLEVDRVRVQADLSLGRDRTGQVGGTEGRWALFRIRGPRSGKVVRVELEGAAGVGDLDLLILDQNLAEVASSRGTEANEACFAPALSREQAYYAVVEAYGPDDGGEFTIRAVDAESFADALEPGTEVAGTLPPGGERFYRIEIPDDSILDVKLLPRGGGDIDLQVIGSDGTWKTSQGMDAQERAAVNATDRSEFLIRVYGAAEDAGGPYAIQADIISAERLARSGRGGTRWWGLYVGIEDYHEINDLTYTCGDAIQIYGALADKGEADATHSIILIDEAATHDHVVAALREMATRVDEDDVFVFFYSGHGGNDREDGSQGDRQDESDGVDEYICCWDSNSEGYSGDLLDDELSDLLDQIHCKILIFFDSCFGGGFQEVIDGHPGRFAIFSSREDQVSAEASEFKAGLMVGILLQGMLGMADANRDRSVSIAELQEFTMTTVLETCPDCQAHIPRNARTCPECGAERQEPVSANELGEELIVTQGVDPQNAPQFGSGSGAKP